MTTLPDADRLRDARILLDQAMTALPLVAILRGVKPDEVLAIGRELVNAGFRIIEVPLNSPSPLDSIRRLADGLDDSVLVGAGTVLEPEAARQVAQAGGRLVVMPHWDPAVVQAAQAAGCVTMPGIMTPTEAFAALAAGADGLKIFPAEMAPPAVIKALRAVLPPASRLLPVGGIDADNMAAYRAAGASGFGLGSSLYKPGLDVEEIGIRARRLATAMTEANGC